MGSNASSATQPLPVVPLSDVFALLDANRITEVVFLGGDWLKVVTQQGASRAARLVPSMPLAGFFDTLVKKKVRFFDGRKEIAVQGKHLFQLLLLAASMFCYWRVSKALVSGITNGEDNSTVVRDSDKKRRQRALQRNKVSFDSIRGVDSALLELREVIDFLRRPERYRRFGARCPKGVLLAGPPGCGKTLMARAAANEAGVDFIACSASDFVELYVGRGAARVRELFKSAQARAPCVLFFDEIDALAKSRQGGAHGNDEREQTLNQLLTQMDGFDVFDGYDEEDENGTAAAPTDEATSASTRPNGRFDFSRNPVGSFWAADPARMAGAKARKARPIVIIAATNRPEILDAALVRPGRFDRLVKVPLPDRDGRRAILGVHVEKRKTPLDDESVLDEAADMTPGFSGAELENIVNEASLLAVRYEAENITRDVFLEATQKVKVAHEATLPNGRSGRPPLGLSPDISSLAQLLHAFLPDRARINGERAGGRRPPRRVPEPAEGKENGAEEREDEPLDAEELIDVE